MSKKLTTGVFIERARVIHGGLFDYSRTNYISMNKNVELICRSHGSFFILAGNHIGTHNKQGCPSCGGTKKSNTERFVQTCIQIYGVKYDYSKVEYKSNKKKVLIICKQHGEFRKSPYHFIIRLQACPKCSNQNVSNNSRFSDDELLEKLKEIHPSYSFDISTYKNQKSKIEVFCGQHYFKTTVGSLLLNTGCPNCSKGLQKSKGESELSGFIDSLYLKTITSERKILKGSELDIYIPSKNIAIEYDGLYYHSTKFIKDKKYHLNKTVLCSEKEIQLIHVFEDEWVHKKKIVKSRLLSIIGVLPEKVYARKCELKEVPTKEAMVFLDDNHIQGRVGGRVKLGLYYDKQLVSLMTFGKTRNNLGGNQKEGDWELMRFCNKINHSVVGGASRLLKHFEREYSPNKIISYADKRWSIGGLYFKLGFEHTHDSSPNYFYVINGKRQNRYNYRKDILIKQGYDPNKSEREIMENRGKHRIYDCGTMVFVKTIHPLSQ